MPTEIGPRRPTKKTGSSDVRGPGYLLSWFGRFARTSQAEKDQVEAERAARLTAFVAGQPVPDVWALDIAPVLEEAFDSAVQRVMDGETHPDVLKALVALYRALDKQGNLAAGAARRRAEAELRWQASVDATKETG